MARPGGSEGGGEMCNVDKKTKKPKEYFEGLTTGVILGIFVF